MECQTVRRYLDCLPDGAMAQGALSPAAGTAEQVAFQRSLLRHLQHCDACRECLASGSEFDRALKEKLLEVPVPAGLEARLLSAIDTQAHAAAPRLHPRRRWSRWQLSLATAMTLAVLAALGVWHLRTPAEGLLDFGGAGQKLMAQFLRGDLNWQSLDAFDDGFDLGDLQQDLGQFRLSPAHGIDLGGGRGQDAAVFRFGLKNWEGILTVLPCQHFTGLPDANAPGVLAGRSVLQWRSSDGRLTYILFVHRGSAAELASELFGRLT